MNKHWWQTVFDQRYLSFYRPIITPQRTSKECNFVEKQLDLNSEGLILDVPCGFGRHSIELAKRGRHMTGLDYSQVMIDKAIRDAKESEVTVDFRRGDMRKMPFGDALFDATTMLFTSFGYLGDAGDRQTLSELHRVLRPGGKLILDQQNGWPAAEEAEQIGNEIEPGAFEMRSTLQEHEGLERMVWRPATHMMEIYEDWNDEMGSQSFAYSIRVYKMDQLKQLLEESGFEIQKVFGSFSGTTFMPFSERMIFIARKV